MHIRTSLAAAALALFASSCATPLEPMCYGTLGVTVEVSSTPLFRWSIPPNQRLLLPGRKRLRRRAVCLTVMDCGGFGTPHSRSAGRYVAVPCLSAR
jgi:hypothetical protein